MTAVAPAAERAPARTLLPGRLLLLALPVGPAAVAVLRFLLPYTTTDSPAQAVAATSGHLGRESAVLWLTLLAVLTLVPGFQLAGRLTRPAAPRLTAWAIGLIVPAYLCLGAVVVSDNALWSGAQAGVSRSDVTGIVANLHPSVVVATWVFVVGHVVGTVLFGSALLRSRTVPAWAGWTMLVSQPLHFVAAVVLGSHLLDLIAWTLTAVAMAVVARALFRGGALAGP